MIAKNEKGKTNGGTVTPAMSGGLSWYVACPVALLFFLGGCTGKYMAEDVHYFWYGSGSLPEYTVESIGRTARLGYTPTLWVYSPVLLR